MQQKMKAITLNEAVTNAGNPMTEVYMMVRVYGDTTIDEISRAEGFYVADDEADPEEKPKKTEKRGGVMKQADHGTIVALYTANPARSVKWIADDQGVSQQTVINHLKKEGIYDPEREKS